MVSLHKKVKKGRGLKKVKKYDKTAKSYCTENVYRLYEINVIYIKKR